MFLITQKDLEDLSDDPRQRFVEIEQLCRLRYREILGEDDNWDFMKDCKIRYMSTVLASAKYLEIFSISELSLPDRSDFNDDDYNNFISQIEFYSIQLMLEAADRSKKSSILLEGTVRNRLSTLTSHLRDQVSKLDISEKKRLSLLNKIDEFEKDLSKSRLTFLAVASISLAVAGAIADIGGATDVIRKLISQIEETVGIAKEQQEKDAVGRLISSPEPKRLLPPKSELNKTKNRNKQRYDLDDDIPF